MKKEKPNNIHHCIYSIIKDCVKGELGEGQVHDVLMIKCRTGVKF